MDHPDPIPYAESVEALPSDEADDIGRVVQALKALLQRSRDKTGHFHGDVHVKIHGCAAAEFRVLPNLPPELAQGLFKNERTFSAVVRFSNSASQPRPDVIPDGRGLAIKVFDVERDRLTSDDNSGRIQSQRRGCAADSIVFANRIAKAKAAAESGCRPSVAPAKTETDSWSIPAAGGRRCPSNRSSADPGASPPGSSGVAALKTKSRTVSVTWVKRANRSATAGGAASPQPQIRP